MKFPALRWGTLSPIRLSYFLFFFSLACFLPFLPVFLKEIGLDAEQAGIITGTRPIVQCLFLPLWGYVADKTQRYRAVLVTVIVISTLITFSSPWLPDAIKTEGVCPGNSTRNESRIDGTSQCRREIENITVLFYAMLAVFCGGACFDGAIPSMIDTAAVERLRNLIDTKVTFGHLRLFGSVGFSIASLVTGVGVQLGGSSNYFVAFYLFLAANMLLTFVSLTLFKGVMKQECQPKVFHLVLRQLYHWDVIFFLATIGVMGLANGVLYGFMFWFLSDLGGSEILMGVSLLVSGISELVVFPCSSYLIRLLGGNIAAIGVGTFSYGIRFLAMSYLENPWVILPLQLFHSLGFALFWSAAIHQMSIYSSNSTQATMVSILNALHFGIASGLAGMVGGVFYKKYGGRQVFRYFSSVCFVWSLFVLIAVVYRMHFKRESTPKEKDTKDNESKCSSNAAVISQSGQLEVSKTECA